MNTAVGLDIVVPAAVSRDARHLALGWLWLAVYCLVAAGLMALLLATSRTPLVQDLVSHPQLFKVALVVHVDLSAVIWFFACAGALWSLLAPGPRTHADRTALGAMVAGTLMITAAPFLGVAEPLMNNYVPVLRHPWFFAGLVIAAGGLALQAGRFLQACRAHRGAPSTAAAEVMRFAMGLTAVVFLMTLVCVAVSYVLMPGAVEGEAYYELLFWGGGHVLQFAYTLMLLTGWLVLGGAVGRRLPVSSRALRIMLVMTAAPLVLVPWLYQGPLDDPAHVRGFTELMRWGGLACLPLALLALALLFRRRPIWTEGRRLTAAGRWSMALFAAGGVLGFLIDGSNTMIPAHYHGSIVAVTLSLMGLVYFVLPRLGRPITMTRTARHQPAVYAVGQLMHVVGLAWCGGYGVQRKVAGAAQGLEGFGETAGMALMGLGGLVSVVGGVMFLLVAMTALTGLGREHRPLVAGGFAQGAPRGMGR